VPPLSLSDILTSGAFLSVVNLDRVFLWFLVRLGGRECDLCSLTTFFTSWFRCCTCLGLDVEILCLVLCSICRKGNVQ
jgi:hypothetical protein